MKQRLLDLWSLLRALATDDAYERYVEHHRKAHAGGDPMKRKEFYRRQQEEKWSGVSRCC